MLSPVPPIDLVGANRTVLTEGDGPLRLALVWRNEWSGELLECLERFQDTEEAKVGLTAAHVDARAVHDRRRRASQRPPMTTSQHELLKALLGTYVRPPPGRDRGAEMAKVSGPSFAALHLAWAGSLEPHRPHYYRIQGHRLLVEYDNTTRDANHVHTVWRDPVGDFGMDLLGAHRRLAH